MFQNLSKINFRGEYYFFLLPLFFILHRYVEHLEAIKTADAIFLYFRYVIWMSVILLLFLLLFKNSRKAFIFTFLLFIFQFFFGSIHDSLKKGLTDTFFVQYVFIIPFALVVFTSVFILLKRSPRLFNALTRYLNVLFVILIAIELFQLAAKINNLQKTLPDSVKICDSCNKPDIYLIISDGYAGSRQLKEYFKFDNKAFESYLQAKGFYIVDSSISNYPSTILSMSSMFNWEYLEKIKGTESHEIINRTRLIDYLKKSGYTIKNFSFFKVDDQFPLVNSRHFQTGTQLITSNSFISRLQADIGHNLATKFHIKSEIERIEKLVKSQQREDVMKDSIILRALMQEINTNHTQPKFVYSHFTMPHSPYFFDSKGKAIPGRSNKESDYIEYLQYTNTHMKSVIDHILASSSTPPIIYFMSDHGYRDGKKDELNPFWFYNINAVFFPDGNYSGLYKGMSNVNQFRMLLNNQFKQNLPMQMDSAIYLDVKIMGPIK